MELKKIVVLCMMLFGLCFTDLSFSEWIGPQNVIVSPWGQAGDAFGIKYGDISDFDDLPGGFDISDSSNVVMADEVNGRFKIYDMNGSLKVLVVPPVDRPEKWTINPNFIGSNISLILDKLYVYDPSGDLINENSSPKKARFRKDINNVLYIYQAYPIDRWVVYSSMGELLNTYNIPPLIVGQISRDFLTYNKNRVDYTEVIFDDIHIGSIDSDAQLCQYFERDVEKHIYCVLADNVGNYVGRRVIRYNQCGKKVSSLHLPEKVITTLKERSENEGVPDLIRVDSEYYNPKIDTHGNVYATRRTPDNYSLVKWIWQDSANDKNEGPDAPINLTATDVSVNSVTVAWEGSLQDPGCVTGYQLLRSDAQSGPYHVVAEVYKGNKTAKDSSVEAGNIYYYQIKALSSVSDSAPSDAIKLEIPKE